MSLPLSRTLIDTAFDGDANLKKRVFEAIDRTPQHTRLFEDIAKYHVANRVQTPANYTSLESDLPASKKRKIENGALPVRTSGGDQSGKVAFQAKDISFSIPQRKKLHLELFALDGGRAEYLLRARNITSDEVEFSVPLGSYRNVLRLPVPEKAQKQFNFCLLPEHGLLPADSAATTVEPIIWTVNDGPTKAYDAPDPVLAGFEHGSESVLEQALNYALAGHGLKITYPDEAEFASATPEAHRKKEKAYHVKAFRGSKDGYLFFLKSGIFFGFKKPLLFFPFGVIESTSYTSVLQRTFNLNISYKASSDSEPQEMEFSMIDQADFPGIDAYLKKNQLQDASMAEARRAKLVKVNGVKKEGGEGGDDADDRTELQKAQEEIEDEEDEEDEDFAASDDGGSDGSGTSEEEDDEYEEGGAQDHDLVEEELGSEAEEVKPDTDDDDQV